MQPAASQRAVRHGARADCLSDNGLGMLPVPRQTTVTVCGTWHARFGRVCGSSATVYASCTGKHCRLQWQHRLSCSIPDSQLSSSPALQLPKLPALQRIPHHALPCYTAGPRSAPSPRWTPLLVDRQPVSLGTRAPPAASDHFPSPIQDTSQPSDLAASAGLRALCASWCRGVDADRLDAACPRRADLIRIG
ncbi:hypothetical protein BS50DRAFT_392308 [Corynespora cassiicola Philippines]|uniref:Uncharacterized protein n=1 Tax=Corynespora cassiicola Philippines TaxID=1448308 RepID=A0A2T2NQ07_CORCC|nr:hypothetical protein BS50DRAFT_392308 [Corynespora cassiicola Philippines]